MPQIPIDFDPALNRYVQQEKETLTDIYRYLDDAKVNYVKSHSRQQLTERSARYLYANNGHARIAFAKIIFDEVGTLINGLRKNGGGVVHLVTLIPGAFAYGESAMKDFQPQILRELLDRALNGLNALGMIDVAFFPRYAANDLDSGGTINPHAHVLVWGRSESTIRRRCVRPFQQMHASLFPTIPSAKIKKVALGDVPATLGYLLKGPRNAYAVSTFIKDKVDQSTREITQMQAHLVRKELLRTGEAVRVSNAMSELYLDDLIIASGEGGGLRDRILEMALQPYRAEQERRYRSE